jgi:hypothetical protein
MTKNTVVYSVVVTKASNYSTYTSIVENKLFSTFEKAEAFLLANGFTSTGGGWVNESNFDLEVDFMAMEIE